MLAFCDVKRTGLHQLCPILIRLLCRMSLPGMVRWQMVPRPAQCCADRSRCASRSRRSLWSAGLQRRTSCKTSDDRKQIVVQAPCCGNTFSDILNPVAPIVPVQLVCGMYAIGCTESRLTAKHVCRNGLRVTFMCAKMSVHQQGLPTCKDSSHLIVCTH